MFSKLLQKQQLLLLYLLLQRSALYRVRQLFVMLLLFLLLLLLLLQDMLCRLLAYDPRDRLTLEEALTHSFLQRQFEGQQLASRIEESLLALEKQ